MEYHNILAIVLYCDVYSAISQFFHRKFYDIDMEILSKLGAFHLLKEQQQKIIIVLLPDVVVYTIHL